jgi:acetate kinase
MQILVVNSGSSSIKFSIFALDRHAGSPEPRSLLEGQLSGIGAPESTLTVHSSDDETREPSESRLGINSLTEAIAAVLDALSDSSVPSFHAVGYRVVHPGPKLDKHQRITPEVMRALEEAREFAPLHDPAAVQMIRAFMARFPNLPHYACFDTVFHQTMPEEATTYPLPPEYAARGVRRYGFHGLSCESIVRQLASRAELPARMTIAHLGSGCSVTALLHGQSIDTTMGLTPTGGVVMGTRSGDLDPGLVLYLLRDQKQQSAAGISAVETLLNNTSGMVALSGMANDVKAVRAAANNGNQRASLALNIFTRSITKAIGSFCWLLGSLDAIVLAGGIGEHDPQTRTQILSGLSGLGVNIDEAQNAEAQPAAASTGIHRISTPESKIAVFIVPAREDLMIAVHVERMKDQESNPSQQDHPHADKEHHEQP